MKTIHLNKVRKLCEISQTCLSTRTFTSDSSPGLQSLLMWSRSDWCQLVDFELDLVSCGPDVKAVKRPFFLVCIFTNRNRFSGEVR